MFLIDFYLVVLFCFQATAYVTPQLWQPPNGTLMTNDVNDNKPAEESTACIALSKNDSYVMSASGGKVSLFNMMTFKVCYCYLLLEPSRKFYNTFLYIIFCHIYSSNLF